MLDSGIWNWLLASSGVYFVQDFTVATFPKKQNEINK